MELQFEKRELGCLTQVLRAVKDQELTQEVRLTEDLPDVGRVIAGWGQVILRSKEWQGSHMTVAGAVMAWVLYAPEDGTEPRMVDAWIPFQMKWEGAQTDREGPMRVLPLLRFVDGRNLSARKILIRAGLSCLAEGMTLSRTAVYTAPEVPEDVELLRRSYPLRLPREAGEKTFTLEESLDLGSSPVSRILCCGFRPELSESKVSGDKVDLRGTGRLHLLCSGVDGRIRARDFEIPFSQLGELEQMYDADPRADVMMAVTGLDVDMEEDRLALKCSLTAQYVVSDRTMLELVEDAYSPRREVAIRQEELHLPAVLDETTERICARAALPEMTPDVADAVFLPGFPQLRREGDRVKAVIPARFQMLDGSMQASCANWEGEAALEADPSGFVEAQLHPIGQPQWVAKGSGMEVRADAEICMRTVARKGIPMITSLECGPLRDRDPGRPSLVICRPGKRSLWEVARASGSSAAAIRAANGLEEEPSDNRMLLIPIQ